MEYLFLVIAYIIGAIPFSYIFGKKFKNKDLRKHGSGNLGTTNAFRVLGKTIGILVLVLDVTKSGILILLVRYNPELFGVTMLHPLFYGLASIVGHIFPVWMKFRGGKGVASSFGLVIAYAPWVGIPLIPYFILVIHFTKYVSLASTTTALATSIIATILYFTSSNPTYDIIFMIVTWIATVLIFFRHRQNFIKLFKGTENKSYLFKKKDKKI